MVSSSTDCTTSLTECESSFRAALNAKNFPLFENIQRWIIAHSGGADSQVLLALAARFFPSDKLLVLHVNHHLQSDADNWAEFSMEQARKLGVRGIVVDAFPENSSELAARDARYSAFESIVGAEDCLLLGHHADDQVETLLFRWLRGTGLQGASGMPQQRPMGKGVLFRPLLDFSRKQIESIAQQLQLAYVNDASNQNCHYDRNYLRHKIVPVLAKRWPNFQLRWQKNAEQLSAASELLNEYLDSDLKCCEVNERVLDLSSLQSFAEKKQFALLRRWVLVRTGTSLNQEQLCGLVKDVVLAQEDAQPEYLLKGSVIRRYQHKLYLCADEQVLGARNAYTITGLGEFELGDGVLKISSMASGYSLKQLDGLEIRRRQGGEKLRPAGRNVTKTVKQLLQDAGVPPWLRQHWPLVFYGEKLVAVPGICVSEGWQVENSGFSILWCSNSLSD